MRTIYILFLIWTTASALYPPANYDTIVTNSVDVLNPKNIEDCDTEKSHVIGRPALQHFLSKLKSDDEKPKKAALLIHRPVLISSLSGKPAEIIKIVEHKENKTPENVEKHTETVETSSESENELSKSTKFTINAENLVHSDLSYSHGYSNPVQDCDIPHSFSYGYTVYPPIVQVPTLHYGPPSLVSVQQYNDKRVNEVIQPIVGNYPEYQVPVFELPSVTTSQKFNNEQVSEIIQPDLYINPYPYPERFGYEYSIYSPGSPKIPAVEYGPPNVINVQSFNTDTRENYPVTPATEYGPPKTVEPIFSAPISVAEYASPFSYYQQLPLNENYKPFTLHQYHIKK